MPLIRKPSPGPPATPSPAQDTDAVLRTLATGTDDERWSSARLLAEIPAGVAALGDALQRETNARVREAMFTSLARIATPRAVEIVLPFLRSDDAHVRTEALDALSAMRGAAWPFLATLLRDPHADVRILACDVVRQMPDEDAVRLFCELLESEQEPNVCAAAIEALAEIGRPEALPVLARCEQRFQATPFLAFSIKIAADRIRSQSSEPRA